MFWLKQSTAITIKLGPFIDDTDGKTAETGLTIAQADIRLSKNGGDIAQSNNAAGATHDELGYYGVPLDTTDIATLGTLRVAVHKSGALPVWQDFMVVTANVWNTLCSTDQLDVNVTNVAGTSQTANDNGADINEILTDTGTTLDTLIKDIPTTAELALRTLLAADYTVVGDLGTVQTGDSFAIVNGDHGLVSIQDDLDEVLTDTGTTLDTLIKAIPTNTEFAALLGAIDTAANTGDPAADVTAMGYIKQLINILIGTDGVAAFPAEASPANAVSLAEIIRAIHADVTGLNGAAMTTAAGVWDATEAITGQTHSFETMMARIYRFLMNKMNITDVSGSVALRNEADGADIATQTVTDDDTTTVRTPLGWS